MQENEIFDQMLSDYIAQNPKAAKGKVLQDFCAYAKNWFVEKGAIGVAQSPTANGIALRFKDGTERLLFSYNNEPTFNQPAMAISGTAGGNIRASGPVADTSIRITG